MKPFKWSRRREKGENKSQEGRSGKAVVRKGELDERSSGKVKGEARPLKQFSAKEGSRKCRGSKWRKNSGPSITTGRKPFWEGPRDRRKGRDLPRRADPGKKKVGFLCTQEKTDKKGRGTDPAFRYIGGE